MIEDTSLRLLGIDNMIGPLADAMTNTNKKLEAVCRMLGEENRAAVFEVILAIADGRDVHYRRGQIAGTIAKKPRYGPNGFGFDPIFIPDGQTDEDGHPLKNPKTYAEMTPQEKNRLSARQLALVDLTENPIKLGKNIYELPAPYRFQIEAIRKEKLNQKIALQHAFNLECLDTNSLPDDLSVDTPVNYRQYKEISYADGQVKRVVSDEDTGSLGIIHTDIDLARDLHGNATRLLTDDFNNLTYWQLDSGGIKLAVASRAYEFLLHHNPVMYSYLRSMMQGSIKTPERSNQRSEVIESVLRTGEWQSKDDEELEGDQRRAMSTVAIREVGYARMSATGLRSRSVDFGIILDSTGIPSSQLAIGGMPPVSGWEDVLVTSALQYMRSWIPRNSIYAGNSELQLKLFHRTEDKINALNLPEDIRKLVIKQIGLSVGCENPNEIANYAQRIWDEGGSAVRIYTTNPDPRVIWTAEAIRQKVPGMTICVGPIVDLRQAYKLIDNNIKTNILLAGHGGGENCTSLDGGGAANGLELVYLMSLDPAFNKTAIGLEGGTGNRIGHLLGFVDVFSLNRRGVAGGIETGGVFVEHINGKPGQPYSGTASPETQWIEILTSPDPTLALKRTNDAGKLRNVEGQPNYMFKRRAVNSITDNLLWETMLIARELADQNAKSIAHLRYNIAKNGYFNHRDVSHDSLYTAQSHRNGS